MATIRKRFDRYQVQVRRKGNPSISKSFLARKDAERWAREMEAALDRGDQSVTQPSRITLRELLQRYRAEITPHKKGRNQECRRLNRLIRDPISELTLDLLSSSELAKFRDGRVKDGVRACQYDLILIRHAIEIGRREWGLAIAANPVSGIKVPNGVNRRERRLEPGEHELLRDAALRSRNTLIWPLVELALETAMRRSELLRMKWDDLSLDDWTVELPDTKNGSSRIVPLTPKALAIIQSLHQSDKHIVPLTENAARQAWERLVARAGISNLRFHDLRHEAISRFFELGLSIAEVALISGHKDVRQLFRYTHLRPEAVASKINQLQSFDPELA